MEELLWEIFKKIHGEFLEKIRGEVQEIINKEFDELFESMAEETDDYTNITMQTEEKNNVQAPSEQQTTEENVEQEEDIGPAMLM